jgi:hypothetical protein
MQKLTRRGFVEAAATGAVLCLNFAVGGGATALLTPREARAQNLPLRKLTPEQAAELEVLGEAMVPGAAKAGLTHFLDHQLAVDPNDALLIAKYFQVALPYSDFYAAGLATTRKQAGKALASLNKAELEKLVGTMAVPTAVVDGFPLFLFYLCLRSDAVDVVYGTPEGFKKLNIPYMQHILPPGGWDA